MRRLVESDGQPAKSDKRFENFGLKGRGLYIILESKSVDASRMSIPFVRLRTLRTIGPTARIKAACADR